MKRRRTSRILFIAGLWILLLVVIVGIFTPVRDIVFSHLFPVAGTPTATIPVGDNLFYIQSTPKGNIFIDERQIPHLPVIGKDHPLLLSPGKHQIRWVDAPFKVLSCIVSVPSSPTTDQCPYESVIAMTPTENVRVVTFDPSLSDLPTAQRAALIQTIQGALNALQTTSAVQPGEQYVSSSSGGSPSIVTATQRLKAILSFHLDTNPNSNRNCESYNENCTSSDGQSCVLLCVLPDTTFVPNTTSSALPQSPAKLTWEIVGLFYSTWTYTTTGGQIVAVNQPDSLPEQVVGDDHSVLAHTTWDGTRWHAVIVTADSGWHAISTSDGSTTGFGFGDPACGSLNDLVNGTSTYAFARGAGNVTWQFGAEANRANGCAAIVTPDAGNQPPAYCLYRFGVLLAANDAAHRYFPALPVADSFEQSIAQQIVMANGL